VEVPLDLVIVESGETHRLAQSDYAARRREGAEALALLQGMAPSLTSLVDIPPARLPALVKELPDPLGDRVRHVVNENQRTMLAAGALARGDLEGFGALVNASHDSLRDLYACSTPRLDGIVARARLTSGVLGARLVGAGWGGSVLVVTRSGDGEDVARALAPEKAMVVVPGAGALA
jgi:galactokinase